MPSGKSLSVEDLIPSLTDDTAEEENIGEASESAESEEENRDKGNRDEKNLIEPLYISL